MLPYIQLLEWKLPSYGTLALIGLALSIAVGNYYAKLYKITTRDIFCASCYGGVGMIVGAKTLYFLVSGTLEGYVFYGGLLGVMAGIWFYTHMMKLPFLNFLNVLAVVVPLFHCIGRIGCFLAGCCYGHIGPLPVQLVESGLNFTLFVTLAVYGSKVRSAGQIMGYYLIAYPIIRIFTEIFREDGVRGVVHFGNVSVSTSQIISLILIPIGLFLLHNAKKNENITS